MPTMQEVRAKFPQYDDMSDAALADALHRKFYSDMPRADFDTKIGLSTSQPAKPAAGEYVQPAPPPGMEFDPATGRMIDTAQRDAVLARQQPSLLERVPGALQRTGRVVDDTVRGVADAASFGFADELAAGAATATGIGGVEGGYDANVAAQRARDAEGGTARLAGQVGGALLTAGGLARNGVTLLRPGQGIGKTALYGIGEGAAYGGLAGAGAAEGGLRERALGARDGAFVGGALGGAAPLAIAGAGAGARRVGQAVRNNIGTPAQQARSRVASAMQRRGMDDTTAMAELYGLGPDAALVDALGVQGQALARSAANSSPEARSILTDFSEGRMAGQNDRVLAQMERAAGLPAGSRMSVDDLKEAAYARVAPEIDAAYREAREAGFDIPVDDFQAIFASPMGREELKEAFKAARNRAAVGDMGAQSRLGILDQLKRRFDARARTADRAGDNDKANQARQLARAVRERLDALLEGPPPSNFMLDGSGTQLARSNPYARARQLRQDAYRTEEAFDLGAELGRRRVPIDGPTRARAADERNRQAVAQGYVATQAANLLNNPATPGVVRGFEPRLKREAMRAALGEGAVPVERQLAREKVFGTTHREITGGSTTARQLAEMGVAGTAGAGLGLYNGGDVTSMGLGAMAGVAARKLGGKAVGSLRAANEAAVAPKVAQFLVANGLPPTQQGALVVMRDPQLRRALARALGLIGGANTGS